MTSWPTLILNSDAFIIIPYALPFFASPAFVHSTGGEVWGGI